MRPRHQLTIRALSASSGASRQPKSIPSAHPVGTRLDHKLPESQSALCDFRESSATFAFLRILLPKTNLRSPLCPSPASPSSADPTSARAPCSTCSPPSARSPSSTPRPASPATASPSPSTSKAPGGAGPVKQLEITDTGGYGVYVAEDGRYNDVGEDLHTLTDDIESQIAEAIRAADLILFAVDCQTGITPRDEEIAQLLREQKLGAHDRHVPVRVVATKCDGPKWEAHAFELAALGFDEPLAVSAKSNYFRRDFIDELYEALPEPDETPEPEADIRIAIIGKRNAGKSTLVNTIAGEKRVIVSEIAGTTRDAVDVKVEKNGKSILLIDTAGHRKKKSYQDQIEWYAFDRAKTAIDRADVILHLIDAESEISARSTSSSARWPSRPTSPSSSSSTSGTSPRVAPTSMASPSRPSATRSTSAAPLAASPTRPSPS